MLKKAYEQRAYDTDTSMKLTEEALHLSQEYELEKMRGKSLAMQALLYMILGDFDLATNIANEAIEILEQEDDKKGIADAKYVIANCLFKTDDYHRGLSYLLECLSSYRELEDWHSQSKVQKSIGTIYDNFGDTESAVKAYQEAIEAAEKGNEWDLMSNAYNSLAGILQKKGKVKEAAELIEKSINYKEKTKDKRGLAFSLYARGKLFTETGDLKQAEKDLKAAEEIHLAMSEKVGTAMCYHKQGQLYFKMGNHELAKEKLVKALSYSNKHNIVLIKYKANELLHAIAKKEGDFELALKYLQQYIDEKERVINTQTAKVIKSYEYRHEMDAMEQEAIRQKERAEINEQKKIELDSFFYRISHDLKGPITSMMSLAYVAKLEVKDETGQKYIGNFETMANRLNVILDSLLTLTKTSYEKVHQEKIAFRKIIDDCIESYQFLENFPKISFEIDVEKDLAYVSDWSLINTIIQNLIENGIKYARLDQDQPWIKINVAQKDNRIVISVKDNGIGMEKETAENVFTIFFRVNRKIPGTGLGMHILKRAVERLKGDVSVTSEPGQGSEFTVTLPCI